MDTQTIAIAVAAVLAAYNVGKFLFKKDDQWERTAEHLLELSTALTAYGLRDIPKGLQLAAIKDVSGVFDLVKFYIDLLKRDPNAVMAEFDKVADRVFEARAQKAALAKVAAATAPVPVAAAA